MKYLITAVAAVAATASTTAAQGCAAGTAKEENGNWYCSAVQAISYTNMGTPGSYDKVTTMENGNCASTPQGYGGGISPLDEEVSWHFRGPLFLKQFASYTPGTNSKRDNGPNRHARHHAHRHLHARDAGIQKVYENHIVEEKRDGDIVAITMNGQVVSWTNNYHPEATATAAEGRVALTATSYSAASTMPTMNAGAGNWGRQAYYNADNQSAEGLTFLNHMGGQGSGVWDWTWGNSLSYASADGRKGSASPQTLANQVMDDTVEIVVMSDTICSNGDCGTVRPGTVAYHGFPSSSKLFLLEFSMPLTGKTGFNMDMPAAWILNAHIPNTMQYGQANCSCWTSGCGEWDIFEILDSGNTKAKSTYHGNPSGGDSNYFDRPTGGTIKAAVVLDGPGSAGHIVILPDSTDFPETIPDGTASGFVNNIGSQARNSAVFRLSS